MKYGESSFDILYLLTAIICGIVMLLLSQTGVTKKMGIATLILGIGDAFHLVPRVIKHFSDANLTAALGIGKLITSVTMTVFYVLMYYIWKDLYGEPQQKQTKVLIWTMFFLRIALCLFPQNGWLKNSSNMLWGIIRNVPFTALGVIIVILFYKSRQKIRLFSFIWLYVTLSFIFYIPVAVGAGLLPILGMLMLPKTICYVLIIITFLLYTSNDSKSYTSKQGLAESNQIALFINACARPTSRTLRLAKTALDVNGNPFERLDLFSENPKPLNYKNLLKREQYIEKSDFSDSMFRFAKQFKNADEILIAAPYWDMSFPAILKCYIESICVNGLTFRYNENGIPESLCKAKRLIYITTAGGFIPETDYGYHYIKQLFGDLFGIKDAVYIKAEGLDIDGADTENIIKSAEEEINLKIKQG